MTDSVLNFVIKAQNEAQTAFNEAQAQIKKLTNEVEKVKEAMNKAKDDTKSFADSIKNNIAGIKINLMDGIKIDKGKLDSISNEIREALAKGKITSQQAYSMLSELKSAGKKAGDESGESFGSNFKSTLMGILAGGAIQNAISKTMDFGKGFFDASSQMEDFRAKFNVLTQDAEKGGALLEKIFKVGAATPFETKEIASATEMLLQYGISSEAVIGTSLRLGDISGGNADRMNGLARAYGQVASAGKANLGDINQMINNGFNPLNEIMKKTGETMGEVRQRISDGKVGYEEIKGAIIAATEPGGQFYNMMDERSKTVSGRISTLNDQISAMGMALLGVSTKGEIVKSGLFDTISEGINNLSGALGLISWDGIGAGLVAAIGTIMNALSTMTNSAMLALAPLQGVFGQLGETLSIIGQGSLQVLVAGFTGLMGAVQALNTIIAPLLTMFLELANMVLPTLFSWLSMIAGPVAIATAAFFAFQGVGLVVAGVSALVSFGISGIIGSLLSLVGFIGLPVLAIGLLALAWQTNFLGIQELTVSAIQGIGGFLAGGFQGFLAGTASFLKGFAKGFNDTFLFIQQLFAGFIGGCIEAIGVLQNGITTTLTLIVDTLVGGFQFMVQNAFDIFANLVVGVADLAMSIGDTIGGMVDFATGLLTGDWSRMVAGAGKTFGGLVGMVLSPAKAVVGIIESAINNVIDMINGVVQNSVVQEVLKKFGANIGTINKVQFNDNFANWANGAAAAAEGMVAGADAAGKATQRLAQRQSTLDGIKSSISGIGQSISKAVDVSSFTNGLRDGSGEIDKMMSGLNKSMQEKAKVNPLDLDGMGKGIDDMTTKLQDMAKAAGESMKNFKLSDAMKNPLAEFQKQIDAQREKSQSEARKLMDDEKKKMADEMTKAENLGKQEKGGGAGKGAADKAQKEAEKQADIQKKAQEDIEKLKAQTIGNAKEREIAMAKQATQQQIDNFKGTESQKAEYARLMQEKLSQDINKTNELYAKKDFDEQKKIADDQKKIAEEQQRVNETLQKAKIQAISDTQTRELEMAKLNSQNLINNFKGTEIEKTQFAASQAQITERETSEIRKKFADQVLAEQKKQADQLIAAQEKANKAQEQATQQNIKAQQEIQKTQVDGIANAYDREIAAAKLKTDLELQNFKGTEQQKAEFAKAQQAALKQDLLKIDAKYLDEKKRETIRQAKVAQEQVLGIMSGLLEQSKNTGFEGSAKQIITGSLLAEQIAAAKNVAPSATSPVNAAAAPAMAQAQQMQNQAPVPPPLPPAPATPPMDPTTMTQPIQDTVDKVNSSIDDLTKKLQTGIAEGITLGTDSILAAMTLLEEGVVALSQKINENFGSIFTGMGGNIPKFIVNGIVGSQKLAFGAVADLSDAVLASIGAEIKGRTNGVRGLSNGFSMNSPKFELFNEFKSSGAAASNTDNSDNSKFKGSTINISDNSGFEQFLQKAAA